MDFNGTYETVTGYPLDGLDDSDESFELLLDGAAEGPATGYGL